MTAHSTNLGHKIKYDEQSKAWVHEDYNADKWRCNKCKEIPVIHSGSPYAENYNGKQYQVDHCISNIVKALNDGNIKTKCSCCSHGKGLGNIMLDDGRELMIIDNFETAREIDKLIFEHLENK